MFQVFGNIIHTRLSFLLPDIRNGDDVEIEFFVQLHERREMGVLETIGKSDHPYADTVVGPDDIAITLSAEAEGAHIGSHAGQRTLSDKIPAGIFHITTI